MSKLGVRVGGGRRHRLLGGKAAKEKGLFPREGMGTTSQEGFPKVARARNYNATTVQQGVRAIEGAPTSYTGRFFSVTFRCRFVGCSTLIARHVLFCPTNRGPPKAMAETVRRPHRTVFVVFPTVFRRRAGSACTSDRTPVTSRICSISRPTWGVTRFPTQFSIQL